MVIGCVCKYGDIFSLAVLIDRGLDQRNSVGRVRIRETEDEMHPKSMVHPYLEATRNRDRDLCSVFRVFRRKAIHLKKLVSMAVRVHPFPYRTRKLSSLAPTILGWQRPGKIGRCQHKQKTPCQIDKEFFCSVNIEERKEKRKGVRFADELYTRTLAVCA